MQAVRSSRRSCFLGASRAPALGLAPTTHAAWGTNNQHKLVPAYVYPDWWNAGGAWYRMCDATETAAGSPIAATNPSRGPGSALYACVKGKPGARHVVVHPGAAAARARELATPVAGAVVIFEGTPQACWTGEVAAC